MTILDKNLTHLAMKCKLPKAQGSKPLHDKAKTAIFNTDSVSFDLLAKCFST